MLWTMEVTVLEDSEKKLIFALEGSGHTVCNALKRELWNTKGVKVATYRVAHPLKNVPEITVETDGSIKPKEAVKKAIGQLQKLNKEFSKQASTL